MDLPSIRSHGRAHRRTISLPAVTGLAVALALAAPAGCQPTSRILTVGPSGTYAKPCAAIAAARTGDTIEIDAAGNGTYHGDVCGWSTSGLTITGVNGRAHIDAAGRNHGGKGIWVIAGNDTVIRNVELSGATVGDRNGAGIRQEGAGLTVSGSSFHDNENGILTGANAASDIRIDTSEFARNGYGDGYSHNIYVGAVRSFTLTASWSHDADAGHLVKSRAATNVIAFNRLTQQGGTGSYELDLPNGGAARVVGNVIQQGSTTSNSGMIAFGMEGVTPATASLQLVNNTIVNDRRSGTAVLVGSQVTAPVLAQNNISTGSSAFVAQAGATLITNCLSTDPQFVNRAAFDHRLTATSPCVDAGSALAPGREAVAPAFQYVYDRGLAPRTTRGTAIDAGAFERP
jgi:hypothetical protein